MLRYEKEVVSEEKDVLKEVICDRCGKQLLKSLEELEKDAKQKPGKFDLDKTKSALEEKNSPEALLPAEFKADFGYTSPLDGEDWKAELCFDCALAVFDFINNDNGQGVKIGNWSDTSLWGEEGYIEPPYGLDKYELLIEDWKCSYHPEEGNLVLSEDGIRCKRENCPTHFAPIPKNFLKEKAEK